MEKEVREVETSCEIPYTNQLATQEAEIPPAPTVSYDPPRETRRLRSDVVGVRFLRKTLTAATWCFSDADPALLLPSPKTAIAEHYAGSVYIEDHELHPALLPVPGSVPSGSDRYSAYWYKRFAETQPLQAADGPGAARCRSSKTRARFDPRRLWCCRRIGNAYHGALIDRPPV